MKNHASYLPCATQRPQRGGPSPCGWCPSHRRRPHARDARIEHDQRRLAEIKPGWHTDALVAAPRDGRVASVEEATALIRSVERAASLNLALCDRQCLPSWKSRPKPWPCGQRRYGVAICTNHFRSAELATSTECWRDESLEESIGGEKFTIADIAKQLHAVNQGESTMQSMIFEPATLKLHLAIGKDPATQRPMRELELAGMLAGKKLP